MKGLPQWLKPGKGGFYCTLSPTNHQSLFDTLDQPFTENLQGCWVVRRIQGTILGAPPELAHCPFTAYYYVHCADGETEAWVLRWAAEVPHLVTARARANQGSLVPECALNVCTPAAGVGDTREPPSQWARLLPAPVLGADPSQSEPQFSSC